MIPGLLLNRSAHTTGLRNLQTTCPGPRAGWRLVRFFQCDAMTRPGGRRKGGGLPFGVQLLLVHLSSSGGHLRLPPPASSGRPAPSGTQRLPRPSQDRLCRAPAPSHCGFDDVTSPSSSPQTREQWQTAPIISTSCIYGLRSSLLPAEQLATNHLHHDTARGPRPGLAYKGF